MTGARKPEHSKIPIWEFFNFSKFWAPKKCQTLEFQVVLNCRLLACFESFQFSIFWEHEHPEIQNFELLTVFVFVMFLNFSIFVRPKNTNMQFVFLFF